MLLCNRMNCLSRIIRNTHFPRLTSQYRSFRGSQVLSSSRFFSNGVKDTKNSEEAPVNEKENGDDQEGEEARESDPYAPFPDNVNPITGERGGPKGPEPTRYGDWERKGRCIDF